MRLTIVCHAGSLAGACVLEASVRGAEPDVPVDVILAERAGKLGVEVYDVLASMYGPAELARALLPFALAQALDEHSEPVVALAPDARVLTDSAPVEAALADTAAVLAPRHLAPGEQATDEPVFDDGFAAFTPEGRELVSWWAAQVLREGIDGPWLDRLPALDERVAILHDPGCAVAPWNLAERALARDGDNRLLAQGSPVRWLRLPGVAADAPSALQGARLSDHEPLRELAVAQATELAAAAPAADDGDDPHTRTASGIALDARLRRLYARGYRDGELSRSLFDPVGAAAFRDWLREPERGDVSRFLYDVYLERPDLQQQYPDLRRPAERDGFHGWAIVHGAAEVPIPEQLLPPEPDTLHADSQDPPSPRVRPPWGVNVAGYFQSELGIGEASRRVVEALDAAHVPVLPVQGAILPPSRRGQDFGSVGTTIAPFAINLICVNADGLPAFAEDVGPSFFEGRYNVGHWAWEVSLFPDRWLGAFAHLDEVWVHSDHLLDALAAVSPIPVRKFVMPVELPPTPPLSRAQLGLPEGPLFYFMFDYHSVFERKNPLGVVEAFSRAFAPGEGPSLAIKCINSQSDPDSHERLLAAAAARPDVHVIDRYVSAAERDAMLATCDCYVSLHRAEGFGFTIAEAMSLGKPVIATAYSGNLDYMPAGTGWLVPQRLIPVGEGCDPYPPEAHWADPDLDGAAAAMRAIVDDPGEAQARGARAAEHIRLHHSPAAAGRVMAQRLETIRLDVAARATTVDEQVRSAASAQLAPLREWIAAGPAALAEHDAGRLRGFGRRLLLRASKHLTSYQRSVDESIADALEASALANARQSEQARLDQLALYAGALARARQAEAQARVDAQRTDEAWRTQAAQIAELRAPLTALPYMEGDPFEYFELPHVGRVQGFRKNPLGAAGAGEDYRYFEDVFRGSRERVAALVEPYVELLRGHEPVLDFGCGRGEMLDTLRELGIEARGVDTDAGMAEQARARGLDVTVDEGIAYLERLEDGSLGAVFSSQVIEHLPYDALQALLRLTRAKLRAGGLLIAETVNPHAPHAMKAFWLDPTHQHPLFPEVVLTQCAGAGFASAYICHLQGVRDVERDRFNESSYAVVAAV